MSVFSVVFQDFKLWAFPLAQNVSAGEAQKLAIARALYKDSPFIILDEPTAALDPVAEYEIYTRFNEMVKNKTAIYISHRLSSCRFCDEIAVFNEGQLIQKGSHETLVSDANGKYYELWNAQKQYYVESTESNNAS
nr:ATP-binding cassette domain-containing protein [Clostridium hydrogenum]